MVLYHIRETPINTPTLSAPVPMMIWARTSAGRVDIVHENDMVEVSWGKGVVLVGE